jgi:hypothetical protein
MKVCAILPLKEVSVLLSWKINSLPFIKRKFLVRLVLPLLFSSDKVRRRNSMKFNMMKHAIGNANGIFCNPIVRRFF